MKGPFVPSTKPEFYVGVVVVEGRVVDLMIHDQLQESLDNLGDVPIEGNVDAELSCWKITENGDNAEQMVIPSI